MSGHLPADEEERIANMCLAILEQMGLRYSIRVMDEPADDDCHGKVDPWDQRNGVDLYIGKDWMSQSDKTKLNTLVHEMCHLLHRHQTDIIRVDLAASEYLPQSAYDLLWSAFSRETELMVDHFATMFDKHWAIQEKWDSLKEAPHGSGSDSSADHQPGEREGT